MIMWLIWAIVTANWVILLGFIGIFHFAQIAFFGIGSYVSGIMTLDVGVSAVVGILCAGIVSGLMSLAISVPALRLRGPYVAVVSLGFSECIRIIASNLEFTRAELGLWGVAPLWKGCEKIGVYYCLLVTTAVIIALLYFMTVSKYGLAFKAIKESASSAESLGVQIYKNKVTVFLVSAFFSGIAGGFYVHYMSGTSPEVFNIATMIDVMVMGMIGGVNSVFGAMIGAAVVHFSLEYLRVIQDIRFIIYACVIISLIIFRPQGVYAWVDSFFKYLDRLRFVGELKRE